MLKIIKRSIGVLLILAFVIGFSLFFDQGAAAFLIAISIGAFSFLIAWLFN